MAEKKEYEMPDSYKHSLDTLLDNIKRRARFAGMLKIMHPARRATGIKKLGEIDCYIETVEQSLADEYDIYQKKCRAEEEEYEAHMEKLGAMNNPLMRDIKENHRELYPKFETAGGEAEFDDEAKRLK